MMKPVNQKTRSSTSYVN